MRGALRAKARLGATLLLVFLLLATYYFHDFWTYSGAEKQNQMIQFMKNLALMGAMLIVIAGFPGAFVSILFTGSVLIEVIFSLDGLGLLGFEAAFNRDYPLMFGTLFFFSLLGLLLNLVGDLMYTIIDPRIDFEAREA